MGLPRMGRVGVGSDVENPKTRSTRERRPREDARGGDRPVEGRVLQGSEEMG